MGTNGAVRIDDTTRDRVNTFLPVSGRELAAWMGISQKTLENLAESGDIPAMNVGGRYTFQPHRVQEWLRTRIETDASPPADLVFLQELSRAVKNKEDAESVCEHLLDRLTDVLQAQAGAIYLSDSESFIRKACSSGAEEGARARGLEGLALWVSVSQQTLLLPSPERDAAASIDLEGPEVVSHDALAVPISLGSKSLGAMVLARNSDRKPFSRRDLALVVVLADQLALAIERARYQELATQGLQEAGVAQGQLEAYAVDVRKTFNAEKERRDQLAGALTELEKTYLATVQGFAVAVEAKDEYTAGHLYRVTQYGLAMMDLLAPERASETQFKFGFLLHDIGKLAIPDAILTKPGSLTPDEWACMRQHPEIGHDILEGIPFLSEANEIVLGHHERWDGTGYPSAQRGDEIPLGARVFPIADSFDAMTSNRPYRKAMEIEDALTEIEKGSGTQFWPEAVEVFMSVPKDELGLIAGGATAGNGVRDA